MAVSEDNMAMSHNNMSYQENKRQL